MSVDFLGGLEIVVDDVRGEFFDESLLGFDIAYSGGVYTLNLHFDFDGRKVSKKSFYELDGGVWHSWVE